MRPRSAQSTTTRASGRTPYHDALWLQQHLSGPGRFFWAARTWGTTIDVDRQRIEAALSPGAGWVLYQVDASCERGEWFATFTLLARSAGT